MPGYGYAEAPRAEVKRWQSLLKAYLRGRQALRRCFVLVDARHGIKEADRPILALLDEAAVTYQLVLTKIDKIKAAERHAAVADLEMAIRKHPAAFPGILATSSETGDGVAELRAQIAKLLQALP
jgi:GTP-binding protein